MSNSRLIKNATYNMIKSISNIIFPIITYPYITRVLMAENVGKISFSQSICSYFALIAALGVSTYAIREGSKLKLDRQRLLNFANEIYTLNIIATLVSYILLIICLIIIPKLKAYSMLILLNSITIIFTTLGCEWINNIYEDFKYMTIRSIIFQLISVILMFSFVRTPDDYIKYCCIHVLASSGTNIINIIYRKKYCDVTIVMSLARLRRHIRPVMLLFSILLVQTIYINSDITMLGWFRGDVEVGIYSVAVKIYTVMNLLVGASAIVVIPQMSHAFGEHDFRKINTLVEYGSHFIALIGIPSIIGANVIAKEIILLLAGPSYIGAKNALHILTVASGLSYIVSIISNMILVPSGKEGIALKASIFSAVANVGLNMFLIPIWGIEAAACTTVMSELVSLIIVKNKLDKEITMDTWMVVRKPLIASLPIVFISYIAHKFFGSPLAIVVFTIIISVTIYCIILLLLRDSIIIEYAHKLIKD